MTAMIPRFERPAQERRIDWLLASVWFDEDVHPAAVLRIATAIIAALVLAACGGGEAGTAVETSNISDTEDRFGGHRPDAHMDGDGMPGMPGGRASEIRIVAGDYRFSPPEVEVAAGEPLTIEFMNRGKVEHDYTIHDAAGAEVEGAHAHAAPGERATATVTLDAGTYEVWCTVPGHKDLGMKGTLTAV